MTDVALGIFYEYVGETFYDFLLFNIKDKKYKENTFDPYKNYDVWAKYIFEVILV